MVLWLDAPVLYFGKMIGLGLLFSQDLSCYAVVAMFKFYLIYFGGYSLKVAAGILDI